MEISITETTPGHSMETDAAVIKNLLHRLIRQNGAAALWLDSGLARVTVQLEGVELDSGHLLLRMPAEASPVLEKVTSSESVVCVMNHPECSIRFACEIPASISQNRTVAVAIPEAVYRLSRRSGFRVPLPPSARLHVGTVDGEPDGQVIDALDLSLGGVGLLASLEYAAVRELGECLLELPDGPRVPGDLRVCNRAPFMRLNGEQGVRLGLAFRGLAPAVRSRVRRYLESL